MESRQGREGARQAQGPRERRRAAPPSAPTLLAAKYRVPEPRAGIVPRARLLQALDRALAGGLTLVSAPPGFGKSTLLALWAAKRAEPVAWLSLDPGDADVTRFLEYLVAAIRVALPGRAETAGILLGSGVPTPVEGVLTALLNDLAGQEVSLVVVFDDYHHIDSAPVHQAVGFLVEHLPAGVHLALATRADPPLPLARWRARGLLAEIRAGDLRFTPAETSGLLAAMDLELGEETAAVLCARSEGWAAALQLAALSLRGRGDAGGFVRGLAGAEDFILDYLTDEVLSRLPPSIEGFLLRTCVLDRLCGPLCDALSGEPGGQAALRALERQNLFLEALDADRQWYRFHSLFADLLRQRLGRDHPELVPELHRRASAWHEEQGSLLPAVGHALAAGDHARAALLIESTAEASLAAGEFATVARLVDALPDEAVTHRPLLCALYGVALFYSGRPAAQVERVLAIAEEPGAGAVAQGVAAAMRAVWATLEGDGLAAQQLASRALRLLPEGRVFARALAGTSAGLAALNGGDVEAAERAFQEALLVAARTGNLTLQVLATRRLANIAVLRGDLRQAEARYRRILDLTGGSGGRRSPLAALALVGLGGLLREWNLLPEAEDRMRAGLEAARLLGPPFALDAFLGLSRVLQARGDLPGATLAMEEAARLATEFDATSQDDAYVGAMAARLHLAEGDVEGAARWAAEPPPMAGGGASRFYPGEAVDCARARWLLHAARPRDALALLTPLIDRAEAQGRLGSLVELEVLRARALDQMGQQPSAGAALSRALTLGAPHGHLRVFLDEGEPLARLLRRHVGARAFPPYGRTVLAAFGSVAAPVGTLPDAREGLSAAERRALRYLATTLSVPEIAQELYVAPATVRSHVKAIYRKLGVSRRAEAVARARTLGLI